MISAVAHATFGAIQKGRHNPWLVRGAIDFSYLMLALPFALFVAPWPEPHLWPIFAGMWAIHFGYKLLMGMAYQRGAFTAVYPVVRGTGPLITVIFAWVLFNEHFDPLQWAGVLLLSGAILSLALINIRAEQVDRATLRAALLFAFASGIAVALYTVYDAWGIRQAPDPFTFLAWFFVIDGTMFPVISYVMWRRDPNRPAAGPLMLRGLIGGVVGLASFGFVMMATRLDKIGEAAALRETSVVFAALIGWFFLGERVGKLRAAMMILIAMGAVLVEFG